MNKIFDWLDDRTGYRALVREALYENIPGGSRWRYVWGSTLIFTFSIQMITGLFLWMAYSPSALSAWESVFYIQFEMQGGWLVRGIHHFTAQAMIVLLVIHLLQIVIDKAYKAPREVNFWVGLILMQIVLGLSLTGYLLPWDQKGYWATRVATNLMGLIPFVGDEVQRLVVGGPTYGHATLTRFFALHAGVLPLLLMGFLGLHIMVFRRHGICAKKPLKGPDEKFWPRQVFKDSMACLAVLAFVLILVFQGAWFGDHAGEPAGAYLGAELGAPADGAKPYSAARPEWYFLFLFQFLKYFHGTTEIFGAIIIPGLAMAMLFLMPILAYWKWGHRFNLGVLAFLAVGISTLTLLAIFGDRSNEDYRQAVETAEINRHRAVELARANGIPVTGAASLLRNDPKTQGPVLFVRHCASCHTHKPIDGSGEVEGRFVVDSRNSSAANLYMFATRRWLTGLLDPKLVDSSHYFGDTTHKKGAMVDFVKNELSEWDKADIAAVIAALAAEAGREKIDPADEKLQARIETGREILKDGSACGQCHKFHDANDETEGPDLTGYGSRQWLIDFISDPSQPRFYGDNNDRMPSFAKDPNHPTHNILRRQDIELVVDWLRGDWLEPSKETEAASE